MTKVLKKTSITIDSRNGKSKNGQSNEKQQCIGPHCSYDAKNAKSPTGFTWSELQVYRENNIIKSYALKGIYDITPEMLLDRPIPTHEKYKEISSKEVKR